MLCILDCFTGQRSNAKFRGPKSSPRVGLLLVWTTVLFDPRTIFHRPSNQGLANRFGRTLPSIYGHHGRRKSGVKYSRTFNWNAVPKGSREVLWTPAKKKNRNLFQLLEQRGISTLSFAKIWLDREPQSASDFFYRARAACFSVAFVTVTVINVGIFLYVIYLGYSST